MKIGNKYPLGDVKADCWQIEYDSTLTSAATTVTISGLTGDTAEEYLLIVRAIADSASIATYVLRPNNDSTGSIYGLQSLYGSGASAGAGRSTGSSIYQSEADSGRTATAKTLIYAKTGHIRLFLVDIARDITGTTVTYTMMYAYSYNETSTEITSLALISTETDGFGVGTEIILYKKVDT